jgi:hypothetical protein
MGEGRLATFDNGLQRKAFVIDFAKSMHPRRILAEFSSIQSNTRRGSESNRRIQLLQSRALPLGYPAL